MGGPKVAQEKTLVFISHIVPEKEIALSFKELIENSFLGMIEVFVSSDHDSIAMGQKWLDQITLALKRCAVEIVVCSPKSVLRPWINFEAGAGWIRDISVVPLCHSGMEPSKLPTPLNLLQAAKANEISSLKLVFPVLAAAIGAKVPVVDFTGFVEKVIDFESQYTFWDNCNTSFGFLARLDPIILPELKNGKAIKLNLSETQLNALSAPMKFLQNANLLRLVMTGEVSIGPGVLHGCNLEPMARLLVIMKDEHFAPRMQ